MFGLLEINTDTTRNHDFDTSNSGQRQLNSFGGGGGGVDRVREGTLGEESVDGTSKRRGAGGRL